MFDSFWDSSTLRLDRPLGSVRRSPGGDLLTEASKFPFRREDRDPGRTDCG